MWDFGTVKNKTVRGVQPAAMPGGRGVPSAGYPSSDDQFVTPNSSLQKTLPRNATLGRRFGTGGSSGSSGGSSNGGTVRPGAALARPGLAGASFTPQAPGGRQDPSTHNVGGSGFEPVAARDYGGPVKTGPQGVTPAKPSAASSGAQQQQQQQGTHGRYRSAAEAYSAAIEGSGPRADKAPGRRAATENDGTADDEDELERRLLIERRRMEEMSLDVGGSGSGFRSTDSSGDAVPSVHQLYGGPGYRGDDSPEALEGGSSGETSVGAGPPGGRAAISAAPAIPTNGKGATAPPPQQDQEPLTALDTVLLPVLEQLSLAVSQHHQRRASSAPGAPNPAGPPGADETAAQRSIRNLCAALVECERTTRGFSNAFAIEVFHAMNGDEEGEGEDGEGTHDGAAQAAGAGWAQ